MWSLRPQLGFWAPELSPERRWELGIPEDRMALEVRWIPNEGARRAGLQNQDVIVEADGHRERMSHPELAQYVVLNKEVGDSLNLIVLRDGKEVSLTVPLVSE
ncbi:MAG: hypothetical protein KatS3mg115_2522 [Candidatus Poribacteria bacterium]|nr:MAG: hypothetical protein KatS3mg115_2522 [Candidatus Poribacteria bacterium]